MVLLVLLTWVAAVIALFGDVITTIIALRTSRARELNPVMLFVMKYIGIAGAGLVTHGGAAVVLLLMQNWYVNVAAAVLFGAISVWNYFVIQRAKATKK